MKNILITGGAGFIGSNLAVKLADNNYHVTVLDNLSPQIHGDEPELTSATFKNILRKGIRFIHGSVTDTVDWQTALKGQDAVIHLAAETGTGQSMYEIQRYVDVNITGTSLMLDLLTNATHSIKKIIVASSRAIYGEGKYSCPDHGIVYPAARTGSHMSQGDFETHCPVCGSTVSLHPTDEQSMIHPTSVYGITKQVQEDMVMLVGKTLGIPAVAFRYQNVYGPGQSLSNPYTGILSIFSTQIRNGNDINIFEDGRESRDFVYIDDVVNATYLGLIKDEANFEIFNVGADERVDVLTVANLLKENYRADTNIHITGNYRLGDIRHNYADLGKISGRLGFTPAYPFQKGISRFCNWVLEQEIAEDRYEDSIAEMRSKGLYK